MSVVSGLVKVALTNNGSRNQLHCTANLNFGVMCKNISGLCQQTFYFCSADIFLGHVLFLAEFAQKFKFFKIAV